MIKKKDSYNSDEQSINPLMSVPIQSPKTIAKALVIFFHFFGNDTKPVVNKSFNESLGDD